MARIAVFDGYWSAPRVAPVYHLPLYFDAAGHPAVGLPNDRVQPASQRQALLAAHICTALGLPASARELSRYYGRHSDFWMLLAHVMRNATERVRSVAASHMAFSEVFLRRPVPTTFFYYVHASTLASTSARTPHTFEDAVATTEGVWHAQQQDHPDNPSRGGRPSSPFAHSDRCSHPPFTYAVDAFTWAHLLHQPNGSEAASFACRLLAHFGAPALRYQQKSMRHPCYVRGKRNDAFATVLARECGHDGEMRRDQKQPLITWWLSEKNVLEVEQGMAGGWGGALSAGDSDARRVQWAELTLDGAPRMTMDVPVLRHSGRPIAEDSRCCGHGQSQGAAKPHSNDVRFVR
jgi:hypothetical protein